MRLRLLLLSFLFLSPGYYLFSQHYPINGSSGWGIVDTNGQMIVPRHEQAFVYDPQLQFHTYLSIFQVEDHFSLYRSRLAQLEEIDFDSLYFGVSRVNPKPFLDRTSVFGWEGPVLSASEYYQAQRLKSDPEHSLQAFLLVKDGLYTLLDQEADTLYHGSFRPRMIENKNDGFIIIAGNKSGYWQLNPNVLVPIKYDKVNLYQTNDPGPACISLKEDSTYHLLVGPTLKDSLQAKGNMRLLYDQRLAIQDPTSSKWGVIDQAGDTIVPLRYDSDFSFLPHATIAREGELEAVIDLSGNEIFPLKYENVVPEPYGTFWGKEKKGWALADSTTHLLTNFDYAKPASFDGPVAVVNTGNKYGLINQYGEVLAEPKYDAIQVLDNVARLRMRDSISQISFHEDGRHNPVKRLIIKGSPTQTIATRARMSAPDSSRSVSPNEWFQYKTKWGLRNDAGVVLPPRFDKIDKVPDLPFDIVAQKTPNNEYLYGIVDPQNVRLILQPSLAYIFLDDFKESQIARAILPNGYYVLLNDKGAMRKLEKVNFMGSFEQGRAIACKGPTNKTHLSSEAGMNINPFGENPRVKGKWGLMRSNGTWEIPPSFERYEAYQHDVAIIKTQGGWGAIDRQQEFIIAPQYDSLYRPIEINSQEISTWFYSVKDQNRQFFFDASGELLHVQQLQDYRIQPGNYLIAQQDDLWGLIDPEGNWQIKPQYADLGDLSEGKIPFYRNRAWGYLNLNGDVVIQPAYTRAMPFYEGKAAIRQGKRWGYIDTTAKELSKVVYLKADNFQDGVAIAKQDKYFGLLNGDNRWVLSPKYTRLERNEYGFIGLREGETFYFELDTAKLKVNTVNSLPEPKTQDIAQLTDTLNRQQAYHHFVLDSLGEMTYGTQCGERKQLVGLLNDRGQEILPTKFEEIEWLGNIYRVLWHGRLGYYSAYGRWVVKPEGYQ